MKLADTYSYNVGLANELLLALNESYSDKASQHGYHVVYAHILENVAINSFFEIGLFLNELPHTDLNAWEQVFPEATIYGADKKSDQLFNSGNIKMYYVDQADPDSLEELKGELDTELDVVLDDASHILSNTINTFEHLFAVVRQGGVYLIEDILDSVEGANDWQQTITDLQSYMTTNGYNYEIFQAQHPRFKLDDVTGEPTDGVMPSDSYIMCVYK